MSEGNLKVISSDGQEFQIDHDIAKQSKLFRSYFDDSFDESIKLAFTDASILKSVIDFCEHHKNDPEAEISDDDDDDDDNDNIKIPKKDVQQVKQRKPVSEWDRAFIQRFSIRDGSLFDIIAVRHQQKSKRYLKLLKYSMKQRHHQRNKLKAINLVSDNRLY
ncbi:unnamed protein product [Adineta ricciae]|uniref:SKP1 component POZ domain-containing protein n=1 Tax=Adineta ricciae TaxID=249248 RepID=A0A814IU33_ADIRI|nr:unnamed protein product [Adineta ricciae]